MGIKKKLMTMALAFAAPLAVLEGKAIRSHAATDMKTRMTKNEASGNKS